MRNMVKQNKQFLLAFCGVLLIILSCSIFVSNSTMDVDSVLIKSIVPVYDEEGTYSVGNTGVIFNDKDQVVKYNIVVENTNDYDVKVTDLQLGTKSEEFLNYTVENINLDDVIKAGESKELVVSFETVKMDGWGRNFNDELVTTLVFDRVLINTEQSKPNNNQSNEVPKVENVPSNNENSNVQPEVNEPVVNEPVVEEPKDDVNHELGMSQEIIVKDSKSGDLFVIFCFGVATGVLGIGLVMINKNKLTKYIVLFVIVGSSVKLASANDVFSLEIPINVSYESQNVMKPSGCVYNSNTGYFGECSDFWIYNTKIKNIYIQNELNEITDSEYVYDMSNEQNGRVVAYLLRNEKESEIEQSEIFDLYLQADGVIYPNENMSFYFSNMNLYSINNFEGLDTSNVTDMRGLFYNSTINFDNLNLSSLVTDNVTTFEEMFALVKSFEDGDIKLDLSGWNVSKVNNIQHMFGRFGEYSSSVDLNLENWNLTNVTDMSYIFAMCGANSSSLKLNLKGWNTENVTNMEYMFVNLGNYSDRCILELGDWNTSKVTSMRAMFLTVGMKDESFTLDVSGLDTESVTNMCEMFLQAGDSSKVFTLDVSNFDTSNVTDMSRMFLSAGRSSTEFSLDISGFDTSKVTSMDQMLLNAGTLSDKFITSITIKNPSMTSYHSIFINAFTQSGAQVTVNYTSETESIVDQMIATKMPTSNVVKGELVVDVDKLKIADEVHIENEKFNVIDVTDDIVVMLAKDNLGTDFRQGKDENKVSFSNTNGWEYTPGPVEIDIQQFDGNAKLYINEYSNYLNGLLGEDSVDVNLITMTELKDLGCTVSEDYSFALNLNCTESPYISWIKNGKSWWTRSPVATFDVSVWAVFGSAAIGYDGYSRELGGIRPVIRVSKETLKKYLD